MLQSLVLLLLLLLFWFLLLVLIVVLLLQLLLPLHVMLVVFVFFPQTSLASGVLTCLVTNCFPIPGFLVARIPRPGYLSLGT